MGKGTRWQQFPSPTWLMIVSTPAFGHMTIQLLSPLAPPVATNIATPSSLTVARPITLRGPNKMEPRRLKDRRSWMPLLRRLIRLLPPPRPLRLQPLRRQLPRLLEPCRRPRHLLLLPTPDRLYLAFVSRTLCSWNIILILPTPTGGGSL